MVYASLPSRKATTRWRIAGHRAIALMDGLRLFVGVALMVDAVRSVFTPDASLLGILVRLPGGRALPSLDGVLLGAAFLLRHRVAAMVLLGHSVLSVVNIAEFYLLRAQGLPSAALPFSLVTLALLIGGVARSFYDGPTGKWTWTLAGAALAGPLLLLLHLFSFGATDYTRPAGAIVVFGARVYDNGALSQALADRIVHGIRLYQAGVAPRLVLSGAPDEVSAMKRLALKRGVPEEAIVCDSEGLNTYSTLANLKVRNVVAVSHYYHLARIKLTARRLGIACATSPCPMYQRLAKEPYYIARECAAFASYYLFRA